MQFYIVFFALSVATCGAHVTLQLDTPTDDVTPACQAALDTCAQQHVTSGSCKSTAGAFLLNLVRVDMDNNCIANGTDFAEELRRFYDTNKDGQTCRDEWVAYRTRYLGYSAALAAAEFASFSPTGACLQEAQLGGIPAMDLRTMYANNALQAFVSFCNEGNNMNSNRDCLGLPTICRDVRPDLQACQALSPTVRSLKQKFDSVFVDANGDGTLTAQEIDTDFSSNYDANQDTCVALAEFNNRWTTVYGLSVELAEYVYKFFDNDKDGCLSLADISAIVPTTGLPAAAFPGVLMADVVTVCKEKPSLYESNADCAQAVDTCKTHFPDSDACKEYATCGLQKYADCVSGTTSLWGHCRSQAEAIEVELEGRKVKNILSEDCL